LATERSFLLNRMAEASLARLCMHLQVSKPELCAGLPVLAMREVSSVCAYSAAGGLALGSYPLDLVGFETVGQTLSDGLSAGMASQSLILCSRQQDDDHCPQKCACKPHFCGQIYSDLFEAMLHSTAGVRKRHERHNVVLNIRAARFQRCYTLQLSCAGDKSWHCPILIAQ
jgi:hypothetical protein